jgi:hypothetical protein
LITAAGIPSNFALPTATKVCHIRTSSHGYHNATARLHRWAFRYYSIVGQEKSEEDGGGCDLVYFLPSALTAGGKGDQDLEKAARVLDEKLPTLVNWLAVV